MKKILFLLLILLSGCASSEHKAWKAQCLPYTGCPLNLETPEQFAYRRQIEEQCLRHTGCPDKPGTQEEFEKRLVIEEKTRVEKLAQQESEKKQDAAKKAQNDQIAKECQWEVAKAMGSGSYAYNAYMAGVNAMADTFREVRLMRQCYEAKGFIF